MEIFDVFDMGPEGFIIEFDKPHPVTKELYEELKKHGLNYYNGVIWDEDSYDWDDIDQETRSYINNYQESHGYPPVILHQEHWLEKKIMP
jgi:hypothetical protein